MTSSRQTPHAKPHAKLEEGTPNALPSEVLLCEVGPRDGYQYEEIPIPTDFKIRSIHALVAAGLRRLQIASFVHPRKVPQMADAEAVVEACLPHPDGTILAGLALNRRGVERAIASGLKYVDLSIATHDRHSLDNAGMTVEEAVREAAAMVDDATEAGLRVQMGFQTVFGYRRPADTPVEHLRTLVRRFAEMRVDEISLGDTTGMANPRLVKNMVVALTEEAAGRPMVLHLHDTRGLGLANVVAGLEVGITRFDTAMGGLGGCPFIAGASGNIATEDTAYLLSSIGISTGLDLAAVARTTREVERLLGKSLPGKMHRILEP